eukprot:1948795-Ditylum_brightwellii.AAC.1
MLYGRVHRRDFWNTVIKLMTNFGKRMLLLVLWNHRFMTPLKKCHAIRIFYDKAIDSDCDSLSSNHDDLDLNALAAHLLNEPLDSLSANHDVRTWINTANPVTLATSALQLEERMGLLLSVFLTAFLEDLLVPVILMEYLSHLRLVKYTDS